MQLISSTKISTNKSMPLSRLCAQRTLASTIRKSSSTAILKRVTMAQKIRKKKSP